jgi:ElaB/YqjD/DUF883 family membrane-anchored ribosome-binding protein
MTKTDKLDQLIDDSEELLTQLADAHNPEIQQLRDRVDDAVRDARRALQTSQDSASLGFTELARTIDEFVHDHPWLALATGVLVASTVSYIAGSFQSRSKEPA